MNTFLCTIKSCETTNETLTELKRTNIRGIAVKLSRLKALGISLEDVLVHSGSLKVLVDAEYERLDLTLLSLLEQLKDSWASRLLLTVQMKRADALHQLETLETFGIATVLTRGNSAYLKDVALVKNAYENFRQAFRRFQSIDMLAGSTALANRIGLSSRLREQPEFLLELQGYQSLKGSSLWIYFNNGYFSEEATQYLLRRGVSIATGQYICSSTEHVNRLLESHFGFIFLDSCCTSRYLSTLNSLAHT
ncbi:MAG: hypothetical protein D6732_16860 [Methanobacteriota archaeon]|nr:MAG: hypothetical protein D6732_16860 [Euryarchaeota archaeon]